MRKIYKFKAVKIFNLIIMNYKSYLKLICLISNQEKQIKFQNVKLKQLYSKLDKERMRNNSLLAQFIYNEIDFPNSKKGGYRDTGNPESFPDIF